MEKERILQLSVKADRLSTEEKAEVREAAKEAGLVIKFGARCKNCYADALALMWKAATATEETAEGIPTASGKYRWMHRGSRVMWFTGGLKYTLSAGSSDDLIKRYIAENPGQELYKKNTQKKEVDDDQE